MALTQTPLFDLPPEADYDPTPALIALAADLTDRVAPDLLARALGRRILTPPDTPYADLENNVLELIHRLGDAIYDLRRAAATTRNPCDR